MVELRPLKPPPATNERIEVFSTAWRSVYRRLELFWMLPVSWPLTSFDVATSWGASTTPSVANPRRTKAVMPGIRIELLSALTRITAELGPYPLLNELMGPTQGRAPARLT